MTHATCAYTRDVFGKLFFCEQFENGSDPHG